MIRAVEGPLASVRGEPPEAVNYAGAAENLRTVWVAVRASLRTVLDDLTLADVVAAAAAARRSAGSPSSRTPGRALDR